MDTPSVGRHCRKLGTPSSQSELTHTSLNTQTPPSNLPVGLADADPPEAGKKVGLGDGS